MLEAKPQLAARLRAPVDRPWELDLARGPHSREAQVAQPQVLREPDHESLVGGDDGDRQAEEHEVQPPHDPSYQGVRRSSVAGSALRASSDATRSSRRSGAGPPRSATGRETPSSTGPSWSGSSPPAGRLGRGARRLRGAPARGGSPRLAARRTPASSRHTIAARTRRPARCSSSRSTSRECRSRGARPRRGSPLDGSTEPRRPGRTGLQELHGAGLVHRDVQPSTILMPDSGWPKLADSGVARFETSRLALTSIDQVSGAPLFMSPEQAVGERVDARSDLFALGAVAYRLLTGRDAFEAEGPQGILARVGHDSPAPRSALVPGLPSGVDAVLARALAKSRKDRYADGKAFCDDVDDLLAGRPPTNARVDGKKKEDTATFLKAAGVQAPGSETAGTGSIRLDRRPVLRGLVGVVSLALVRASSCLRRRLETSDATPGAIPSVDLDSRAREDATRPNSARTSHPSRRRRPPACRSTSGTRSRRARSWCRSTAPWSWSAASVARSRSLCSASRCARAACSRRSSCPPAATRSS